MDEIARLAALGGSEINEAKKVLATEVTAMLHGRAAAEQAAETARKTFEEGALADTCRRSKSRRMIWKPALACWRCWCRRGCRSNGEARRHIQGGAVRLNDQPVSDERHHEIELVVAVGEGGANIGAGEALKHVWGYGVGVDLTRRDLQDEAKKMARPWDWSKGFDNSAVCSALIPADKAGNPDSGRIWLSVNGVERQSGDLADMIWPVADIIAFCSQSMTLQKGDLIYTGTPAGVSELKVGDHVTGGVEGMGTIDFTVSGGAS
jgi:hypothetical protein